MRKSAGRPAQPLLLVALLSFLLPLPPTARASQNGAAPLHSGGPAGYESGGGNCTACHTPSVFGLGNVELLDAPTRYRAGNIYDMLVRVSDPEQAGAGFQISAEGGAGHVGRFLIRDARRTRNASSSEPINYVTHAQQGYVDSLVDWSDNGGSFDYQIRWEAPFSDEGAVTFFVAGNAVNDAMSLFGDRYYATWATINFAIAGDADGDTDLDLADFAALQRCYSGASPFVDAGCEFVDFDGNGFVASVDAAGLANAMSGPIAPQPAEYALADVVRGGRLYDEWWVVAGVDEPLFDHPLWDSRPDATSNASTGSSTWRCTECHGWDYKGVDGDYGSGDHRTGFPGVWGTALSPTDMFETLAGSPNDVPNGHDLRAAGLSEKETWNIVKMVSEGVVDTDVYIDANDEFIARIPDGGQGDYGSVCSSCHGSDGQNIDLGGQHIGSVARGNPWKFLHTMRHGHPGAPMPSSDLLGWTVQRAANLAAYASNTVIFPD